MIARTWSGRVPSHLADPFEAHLIATGLTAASALPGYQGAQILRSTHPQGRTVEFRLETFWESWEAIRGFAGPDVSAAVLYPGDEAYQLSPDLHVEHHLVVRRDLL
ncbi:antibiotic biosynthesis monooxygenase family protein [Nonomuraea sp. NPDC050556]|uniref:antibiotic biosynthesis monooxygenase family protein n=1 Tax=Nonomuraea sp. NPDC050556 TaxID=3364369 RepID=UPI003795D728